MNVIDLQSLGSYGRPETEKIMGHSTVIPDGLPKDVSSSGESVMQPKRC